MKFKFKYLLSIISVFFWAFSSCTSPEDIKEEETPIHLRANIVDIPSTRGYQEKGIIEEGTFYLTYSNPSGDPFYNIATVNFYDATGFITTPQGEELTWQKVGFDPKGDDKRSTFYLDNVVSENESTLVSLNSDTPFQAGKFDDNEGSNDLLWGSVTVDRSQNKIPITLHHSMSMIRVEITIDNSKENVNPLWLKDAVLELTDIVKTPVAYDKLTGGLDLGEQPVLGNLIFTQPGETDWKEKPAGNNLGIDTYKTADFVLPPQSLDLTGTRPRLRISIPQQDGPDRVFSGSLPQGMIVENEDGSTVSMNFSFLREHKMTLKVTMDPDLMKLEFMPVKVVNWVDRGTYLTTGSQAAIFDNDNFRAMMKAYNEGDLYNLERYGYLSGNTWKFNIYGDLSFKEDEIKGKMKIKQDLPVEFKFNGQTVTIFLNDGTTLVLSDDNDGNALLIKFLNGESISL